MSRYQTRPTSGVIAVRHCALSTTAHEWAFASENQDAIDAHWHRALDTHPGYFNGTVLIASDIALVDDTLRVAVFATEFKSYLYWRAEGFPETGVRDCFGSALILTSDDAIILARQRDGHLNSGQTYLPGGFIDLRDVDAAGKVHVDASVARELAEETGLGEGDVRRDSGPYHITFHGPHVSIAVPYRTTATAHDVTNQIRRHIASETEPELAEAVIVRNLRDLDGMTLAPFATVLLPHLLHDVIAGDVECR